MGHRHQQEEKGRKWGRRRIPKEENENTSQLGGGAQQGVQLEERQMWAEQKVMLVGTKGVTRREAGGRRRSSLVRRLSEGQKDGQVGGETGGKVRKKINE